ncbi:MAG: c-type cytochrome [Verrucomicrobia bacterium]|nr:c-type cytochrome [Verrucomicrobiota bacterium]
MNDHRVLNAQTVSNGDAIDPETHKASPEWNVPSDELAVLAEGADMFNRLCAACHGADGGGLLGPNVTDAYWIHGATFAENCQVVENGVPDKGMPAYLDSLSRDEIRAVVSYMFTLRGAGPDDAKEPEGIYVAESGGRAIVPEATD